VSAPPAPSFTCPDCGATSYHPEDVRHGYCGRCHAFTGEDTSRVL
jgi:ribosomal protein S27AE